MPFMAVRISPGRMPYPSIMFSHDAMMKCTCHTDLSVRAQHCADKGSDNRPAVQMCTGCLMQPSPFHHTGTPDMLCMDRQGSCRLSGSRCITQIESHDCLLLSSDAGLDICIARPHEDGLMLAENMLGSPCRTSMVETVKNDAICHL